MAAKRKAKKNPVQQALDNFDPTTLADENDAVFIGVPAGSDLETRLTNLARTRRQMDAIGAHYPFGAKAYRAYKQGSELDPGSWDPNDLVALQMRLHMAGMLDEFIPGSFDKGTRTAYRELLTMANTSLTPWEDMLDQITAVGGVVDDGSGGPPPLTITLANPDDLRSVANTVSKTLYGGNLPADQQEAFIAAFQAAQEQYQRATYAAQYGGAGESVTVENPNAQVLAEKMIREQNPDQVAATQFGAHLDDILQVFTQNRPGGMT